MSDPIWCIMPIRNQPERTIAAISDLLAQTVPTRVLLINQGADDSLRELLERTVEAHDDRLLLWSHMPSLPSLSATWNRALDFVWAAGGSEALIVNNDVRLHRRTIELLYNMQILTHSLFTTTVGVTADQFDAGLQAIDTIAESDLRDQYGGPDFSCFLIGKEGHQKYRFDENFIPAFCEDLDTHRRYLLGGDGSRIFSVNLPYLHYASQTLKTMAPEERAKVEQRIEQNSRAYYAKVWGGPVNAETYLRKDDPTSAVSDGTATTPWLQAHPPTHVEVTEGEID